MQPPLWFCPNVFSVQWFTLGSEVSTTHLLPQFVLPPCTTSSFGMAANSISPPLREGNISSPWASSQAAKPKSVAKCNTTSEVVNFSRAPRICHVPHGRVFSEREWGEREAEERTPTVDPRIRGFPQSFNGLRPNPNPSMALHEHYIIPFKSLKSQLLPRASNQLISSYNN